MPRPPAAAAPAAPLWLVSAVVAAVAAAAGAVAAAPGGGAGQPHVAHATQPHAPAAASLLQLEGATNAGDAFGAALLSDTAAAIGLGPDMLINPIIEGVLGPAVQDLIQKLVRRRR